MGLDCVERLALDLKSIRQKLELAIEICTEEKILPKTRWAEHYYIDRYDKEKFLKCLDIPPTTSQNGVYRAYITDYIYIRVYTLESVIRLVLFSIAMGVAIGVGSLCGTAAIGGGSIVRPIIGCMIGGATGGILGVALIKASKPVCEVIKAEDICKMFPRYYFSKSQKMHHCDISTEPKGNGPKNHTRRSKDMVAFIVFLVFNSLILLINEILLIFFFLINLITIVSAISACGTVLFIWCIYLTAFLKISFNKYWYMMNVLFSVYVLSSSCLVYTLMYM